MRDAISIYGIFHGDQCLYVGRSKQPTQRFVTHRLWFRRLLNGAAPTMRILARVTKEAAGAIERRTILKYRATGQAQFNIYPPVASARETTMRRVSFKLEGNTFRKCKAVASAQGITLQEWMRDAALEKLAQQEAA